MSFNAGLGVLNTHGYFGKAVFAIFTHSLLAVAMHTWTQRILANVCLGSYVFTSGYITTEYLDKTCSLQHQIM